MYITIRYGDGTDPLVVNPDCCCRNFIAFVRLRIPLIQAYESQNDEDGPWLLDLCDDLGFLRYLPEKSPLENLSQYFENRCNYTPILVTKNNDGNFKNLVPLIEEVNPDMDKKLKKYLRTRGKASRGEDSKSPSPSARLAKKVEKPDHLSRKELNASPSNDAKREKKSKSGKPK